MLAYFHLMYVYVEFLYKHVFLLNLQSTDMPEGMARNVPTERHSGVRGVLSDKHTRGAGSDT